MTTIHLTSRKLGVAVMKEYTKKHGIHCAPIYVVPTYEMLVDTPVFGTLKLEVIRAGPSRSLTNRPPYARRCAYGVFKQHKLQKPAEWVKDYSPRTITGTKPGALRLWPGKGWLIHEGPPDRMTAMGTGGCIEIMGEQNWTNFRALVGDAATKGQVKFKTDALSKPMGKLVVKAPSLYYRWGSALYRNWKGSGSAEFELTNKDVDGLIKSAKRRKGVSVDEIQQLMLIWINYHMPPEASKNMGDLVRNWAPGTRPSTRRRSGGATTH